MGKRSSFVNKRTYIIITTSNYLPGAAYKKEWKGMGYWLGTGVIARGYIKYRPFEEASRFVHSHRTKILVVRVLKQQQSNPV